MLTPVRSSQFRRDVKRADKRGKDLSKLRHVLSLLLTRSELPPVFKEHALKGD